MHDLVTGARTEVALTVPLPRERVWELITDVTRHGTWSPECYHAAWLPPTASAIRPGNRFEGRNRFPDGRVTRVVCEVTEAVAPVVFAWAVLDAHDDPARPLALWRYELGPAGAADRTEVRHSFVHGPGDSGARVAALRDPGTLAGRLAQLRDNMAVSLAALAGCPKEDR
ncbi:SRPBCC family protein [Streptomyces avicenniae]|uniref:SRPBCC family protein n=1 Tax=Streptomyces avicenniae TaxID=500153 RepID=UPI00069C6DC3|nr:SRPBCC family protein [Streptomyces avicenniae]